MLSIGQQLLEAVRIIILLLLVSWYELCSSPVPPVDIPLYFLCAFHNTIVYSFIYFVFRLWMYAACTTTAQIYIMVFYLFI